MKIAYIKKARPTKEIEIGGATLILCAFALIMCGCSAWFLKGLFFPEVIYAATFA